MFRNILIPTDGADLAAKAVEQGVRFAKEIGAKITAVTVTEPFELAWRDREQMERLGDRHGGNLGADLLGEENALLDGLGSEIRPVGRDQDVLVHGLFSSVHLRPGKLRLDQTDLGPCMSGFEPQV